MEGKKVRYNSKLPKKVFNRLKRYAKENETPMEVIIELSLRRFMNQKRTLP